MNEGKSTYDTITRADLRTPFAGGGNLLARGVAPREAAFATPGGGGGTSNGPGDCDSEALASISSA